MKQQKGTKEGKSKSGSGMKTEMGGSPVDSKQGLEIHFVVDKNPAGQSEYAPENEGGLGWTDSGTSGRVVEDIDMVTALRLAKEASEERLRNGVGPSRYLPPVDGTITTPTTSPTTSTTPTSTTPTTAAGGGNANASPNTIASFAGAFATPNLFINTPTSTPTSTTPTDKLLSSFPTGSNNNNNNNNNNEEEEDEENNYWTTDLLRKNPSLTSTNGGYPLESLDQVELWLKTQSAVTAGTNLARALAVLPPNVLNPRSYTQLLKTFADHYGWEYEEWTPEELKKEVLQPFITPPPPFFSPLPS